MDSFEVEVKSEHESDDECTELYQHEVFDIEIKEEEISAPTGSSHANSSTTLKCSLCDFNCFSQNTFSHHVTTKHGNRALTRKTSAKVPRFHPYEKSQSQLQLQENTKMELYKTEVPFARKLDPLGEKCLALSDQTNLKVQNVFNSHAPLDIVMEGNSSSPDASWESARNVPQGVANPEMVLIPESSWDVEETSSTCDGVSLQQALSPEQKSSAPNNRLSKEIVSSKEEVKAETLTLRRDKTLIEKQILECSLSVKQLEVELMALSKREKEAEVKIKEIDAKFKEQKVELELQLMNLQNQSLQLDIQQCEYR